MGYRPFSAIRAHIFFDTVRVGWAVGVSVQAATVGAPVKVLGDIYAKLIEPVDTDVTGSFDYIHILDRPLASLAANGRKVWGTHLLTNREWIQFDPPMMTIVDMFNNDNVITIQGAFPQGQNFTLTQGGMMMVDCSFRGIRAFEHGTAIVTGGRVQATL